ncbi:hypothetical protein QWJ34_16445 [Saccharibacillus sp. CPCC 101409]|uniref:hypothetical protein n=1 Tax=Saccharibacillus sp. CPCC 101409 TaxID=3058041 RepID=UPI00267394FB|nr:hypothetical protein [Saccharibacillus sp. CPCC 101409]MDO3411357.1 hypothetical protein [Saccharibacillus sp. CPCC 101409]
MPIAILFLLGAAVLAGAAAFLYVSRFGRRRSAGNVVDLAAVRRRKLRSAQEALRNGTLPDAGVTAKRTAVPAAGAEIRRFVPKSAGASPQTCSSCQKKTDKLGFYMNDYGRLVGVCKECRKSAKNRDLMPL